MGDPGFHDDAALRRPQVGAREPQSEIFPAIWDAWALLEEAPQAAVDRLREAVDRATALSGRLEGGRWLMRLAARVGDERALHAASMSVRTVTEGCDGPLRRVDRDWASAILLPPPEATAALEHVAGRWEQLGCPLPAGDAYADAALAARRAGRDAARLEAQAARLYTEAEAVPALGALPELRWGHTATTDELAPAPTRPLH